MSFSSQLLDLLRQFNITDNTDFTDAIIDLHDTYPEVDAFMTKLKELLDDNDLGLYDIDTLSQAGEAGELQEMINVNNLMIQFHAEIKKLHASIWVL